MSDAARIAQIKEGLERLNSALAEAAAAGIQTDIRIDQAKSLTGAPHPALRAAAWREIRLLEA